MVGNAVVEGLMDRQGDGHANDLPMAIDWVLVDRLNGIFLHKIHNFVKYDPDGKLQIGRIIDLAKRTYNQLGITITIETAFSIIAVYSYCFSKPM
jgi:hypothetical protein